MSRFTIWIVQPSGHPHMRCFSEVAEALAYSLRRLGHEVLMPERSSSPYIIAALPGSDRKFGRSIILGSNFLPDIPLPDDAILYNLEQVQLDGVIGSEWMRSNLLRLLRRHTVWDYSQANILKLRTLGVEDVHYCAVGYVPELTRIQPAKVQDIDVLHYGSIAPSQYSDGRRRVDILDALDTTTIRDPATGQARPLRVEHLFGVYGEERDRMIARAKVVVNIHYFQPAVWEVVRCSYLLANKVCIVSEDGGTDPQLEALAQRSTAYVPYDKLVDTCRALLDADSGLSFGGKPMSGAEARRYLAEAGFEAIRKIDQAEEVRRALAESQA